MTLRDFSCLEPLFFLLPKTFKIFGVSNILVFSVPVEGYSTNPSCTLNVITTFLLDVLMRKRSYEYHLLPELTFKTMSTNPLPPTHARTHARKHVLYVYAFPS